MLSDYIEERYGKKIRALEESHRKYDELNQMYNQLFQKYDKAELICQELIQKKQNWVDNLNEIETLKEKIDEVEKEIEELEKLLKDYGLTYE